MALCTSICFISLFLWTPKMIRDPAKTFVSASFLELYPAIASRVFLISLLPLAWNVSCFFFFHLIQNYRFFRCICSHIVYQAKARIMSLWRNAHKRKGPSLGTEFRNIYLRDSLGPKPKMIFLVTFIQWSPK